MNGLRLFSICCLSALLLSTLTGCQGIGNKFFQIDSNSRSPFFGLQFYTRNEKKQPVTIQNVSHEQPVELEPAILQTRSEEPSRFSRLPKWLNPISKKDEQGERIPLPRTDLKDAEEVVLEQPAEEASSGELGSSLENF